TPTPALGQELAISNLTVASGKPYQVVKNGLISDALVYTDRSYSFTSIPSTMTQATYIKTANDDKARTEESFLSFSVNQPVTIYVAYDARATALPDWLLGWTSTNQTLGTTDVGLKIYTKDFPAGSLTLGGNLSGGATGASSNYSVVVVARGSGSQPTPTSTPTATPSPTQSPAPSPTATPSPTPVPNPPPPSPTATPSPSPAPTLSVQGGQAKVGQSLSLPIVLSQIPPTGLAGYDLEVTLSNPGVARLTGAEFPNLGLTQPTLISSSRLRLTAVDIANVLQAGAANATLATVKLDGLLEGNTTVSISVNSIDDEAGSQIQTQQVSGAVEVVSPFPTLPGMSGPARDLDGDGKAEDVNGNGRRDFADVVALFEHMDSPEVRGNEAAFDFNGNGRMDMADVIELFNRLVS
ncbi:MAG: dockerin type I domain-containing protein, partial [Nitrososphaera sp.]